MAISGTLTETAVERADALRRAPASDEAEAAMAETEVAAARAAICTCLFVRRIEVMQGSECRIEGDGRLGRVSATVRAQSGRGGICVRGKAMDNTNADKMADCVALNEERPQGAHHWSLDGWMNVLLVYLSSMISRSIGFVVR